MDREARGGSLHGFITWCQPSNKLSVSRRSRCHPAWKLYMQPGILTSGRSVCIPHVSWTCSQPRGARGAAAHASGAMRSDTQAATNLKLIGQSVPLMIKWRCCPDLVQFHGFTSVEVLKFDTPPGSPKNCPEAKGGSVRIQISPYRPVSFFMVKPRFFPSPDQSSPVQSSRPLGFGHVLSDQPAASRLEHFKLDIADREEEHEVTRAQGDRILPIERRNTKSPGPRFLTLSLNSGSCTGLGLLCGIIGWPIMFLSDCWFPLLEARSWQEVALGKDDRIARCWTLGPPE
ncbi:hypothetical protein F2Q69_00035977 [Brassica cretica]|uniref:Uncharacterized protein n=1 Tax=Brassica cretica TaxID=69181 RepID=A0A8S9SSC2_BRACR|nr:hypothetical protein F2Q69_00035977 [Brassica cretica]